MRWEERGKVGMSDWARTFLGLPLRGPALESAVLQAQVVEQGFSLKEGFETSLTCIHIAYTRPEQEM